MIVSNIQMHLFEMLTLLHNRPEEYFLTGSRFFGVARSDSDWDFMTPFNYRIGGNLVEMGFRPLDTYGNDGGRFDQLTRAVYRKNGATVVDIQLVNHIQLKIKAQHFLKNWNVTAPVLGHWNMAIDLVRVMPSDIRIVQTLTS